MTTRVTCGPHFTLTGTKMHTIIEVKVKTARPEFRVRLSNGQVFIDLTEAPEHNKANLELIKMLTRLLKRPVSLVSGATNRTKTLKIENMGRDEVLSLLRTE